jgi:uncharacterized protein (TIGR03382 family)
MKKILLATAAILASVGVVAQGTILNANDRFTIGYDAPILDNAGAPLTGADYWVALYAGTGIDSLVAVGAPANFLPAGAGLDGMYNAGSVAVDTVAPGETATIEVRAWEAAGGNTYEAAEAAGFLVGKSATMTITTGGFTDGTAPPTLPTPLSQATPQFATFSLIPEPSTMALGVLGAFALLLRRRK